MPREPIKILVVDGAPERRRALEEMLRPLPVEVLSAPSGPEALEALGEHELSVVVLGPGALFFDEDDPAGWVRRLPAGRALPWVVTVSGTPEPEPLREQVLALCELQRARANAERLAAVESETLLQDHFEAALRAREDFLSVASHELNTPLTSLKLQADSLCRLLETGRDGRPPTDRERRLERKADVIQRQVDRLVRRVTDLLDAGRLHQRRFELDPESVELAELAAEVIERFRPEALRVGSTLELCAGEPARGRWDRVRLGQVLTNLISNALKYGGGRPISVEVTVAGETARLVVRDEGVGIPPERKEAIFGRFGACDGSRLGARPGPREGKSGVGGLKLGLWLTRELVQSMGGQIEVESAPGRGAAFTVELPL